MTKKSKPVDGKLSPTLQKFVRGDLTPKEMHIAAMNKKCEQCGAPASLRIRVLVRLEELIEKSPEYVAQIMATNPDGTCTVPIIPTKYGAMVKVSDIGACDRCRTAAEQAAARCPDWCLVEISAPPEDRNPVHVQVPGMLVH